MPALAHESFLAGGLPVGSVITGGNGERVSEGRNRAYDPAGGTDRLQRTPIAHAEMNALAAVSTETDLGGLTLWSSHRPCLMCAAACEFTGMGRVLFIAPDPSGDDSSGDPDGIEPEWVVVANLLFLSGVAAYSGPSAPMILRARPREPEVAGLMQAVGDTALRQAVLRDCLAPAVAGHTGRGGRTPSASRPVWPAPVRGGAGRWRNLPARHRRAPGRPQDQPLDVVRLPADRLPGDSPVSRTYAITSLAEARAYLAHPVLGARLAECAAILAGLPDRTAEQVFGEVDALKLRSSMTLFMHAAPGEPVFRQVLDRYFGGVPDSATEQRI